MHEYRHEIVTTLLSQPLLNTNKQPQRAVDKRSHRALPITPNLTTCPNLFFNGVRVNLANIARLCTRARDATRHFWLTTLHLHFAASHKERQVASALQYVRIYRGNTHVHPRTLSMQTPRISGSFSSTTPTHNRVWHVVRTHELFLTIVRKLYLSVKHAVLHLRLDPNPNPKRKRRKKKK